METKEFQGTCVENPFGRIEALVKVVENATEIAKQTFLRRCFVPPEEKAKMKQYPNDFEFYKYKNIYFYCWSAIEHFYW